MHSTDISITDAPFGSDALALQLLSFYAMLASLNGRAPPPNPYTTDQQTPLLSNSPPNTSLPKMTISVDASTNIIGHGNTVQLPSPAVTEQRLQHLLEIAFRNLPDKVVAEDHSDDDDDLCIYPPPMDIEVKV